MPVVSLTPEEFVATQRSDEFQALRRAHRRFTFPVSVAFFAWYLFYVVTATFYPEAMAQPAAGMNVGMWLGIAQFATTFAITYLYVGYANKNIEPRAAAIRERMEGQA
nr:DUF485 domain-containing protein [Corynebacterium liangguodongii]